MHVSLMFVSFKVTLREYAHNYLRNESPTNFVKDIIEYPCFFVLNFLQFFFDMLVVMLCNLDEIG